MLKKVTLAALLLTAGLHAHATDYYVIVPMPGKIATTPTAPPDTPSVTVTLNSYTLPAGAVGESYSFDLRSLLQVTGDASFNEAAVSWRLVSGALPAGLSLLETGELSGLPSAAGTATATVEATYKTVSGVQTYELAVAVQLAPSKWDVTHVPGRTVDLGGGRTVKVIDVYSIPAATPLPTSGKVYWEVNANDFSMVGVGTKPTGPHNYATSCQVYYRNNGPYLGGQVTVVTHTNVAGTDTFGFAYDADAKSLAVYRGNVKLLTCTFTTSATLYPLAGTGSLHSTIRADMQPHEMTYAPPAGYTAGIPLN